LRPPIGLAGEGEEHVVEVGSVDRQVDDLDRGAIELVEEGPQRGDTTVARDLERQSLLVPR
jgi:hypothetical protein